MSEMTISVAEWRQRHRPDELCPRCDGWCEVGGERCPVCSGSGLKDLRTLAKERGVGVLLLNGEPVALVTKWDRL